jgi:hypothetical protein
MAWRRCGNSLFYASEDNADSPLQSIFLDPIDLILIRTYPRRDGSVSVRRRQLTDFAMSSIRETFIPDTARLIDSWLVRVAEDVESGDPQWKSKILADLDVDHVERDFLLDALEIMVDLNLGNVEVEVVNVPRNPGAILKALMAMGVPVC